MANRADLHNQLVGALGSNNVYFQPPQSVMLKYPCIVYSRTGYDIKFAEDENYITRKQYTLTLIYKDPDSDLPDKLLKLRGINHTNHSVVDNLYHDYFRIYY